MTANEKKILIMQAQKLLTLGIEVENRRKQLRRLVEKKIPYESPKMISALEKFQIADEEWKQLEKEHLAYRTKVSGSGEME